MHKFIIFAVLSISLSFNSLAEITWEDHPVALKNPFNNKVEFGYLKVTEDRTSSDIKDIYIAFTRVKSSREENVNDAVIFLPGGPGGSYSIRINRFLSSQKLQKILEKRDIILIDPRGTGFSYPKLCDNIDSYRNYYNSSLLSGEQWKKELNRRMQKCAELLKANNVNVHSYNAVEISNDIEELRKELGYKKWNIRGHSYGSYFGFVLMQQFPETIRSALLSGITSIDLELKHYEVNAMRSIYKVIEACKNDNVCREAFPNIEEQILNLMMTLEASPIEIRLPDETGENYYTYKLGPSAMMSGLFSLMYSQKGIEILPAFIDALSREANWIVKNMAPMLLSADGLDRDMMTIVWSNDSDPRQSRPTPEENLEVYRLYNPKWIQGEVDGRRKAFDIIRTKNRLPKPTWQRLNIPTLMLSGDFDPATPPKNADLMLAYLTNAKHHIIPTTGHDSHLFHFAEFYENPTPDIDVSELLEDKSLNFVSNISLNEGVAGMMSKIATGNIGKLWLLISSLILAVITFLYLILNYIYLKIRKQNDPYRSSKLRLCLTAFTICLLAILLGIAIFTAISTNPFMVAIGLPKEWYLLKIGYILLVIFLFGIILKGEKQWSPKIRILSTMTVVAGVGFTSFIIGNGFI